MSLFTLRKNNVKNTNKCILLLTFTFEQLLRKIFLKALATFQMKFDSFTYQVLIFCPPEMFQDKGSIMQGTKIKAVTVSDYPSFLLEYKKKPQCVVITDVVFIEKYKEHFLRDIQKVSLGIPPILVLLEQINISLINKFTQENIYDYILISGKSDTEIVMNILFLLFKLKAERKTATKEATNYKKQNEELLNINKKINENRTALKMALEEAENANNLKNKFLSNMSHEVRTPMNAILGFSQLLSEASDTEKEQYIEIIKSNSEILLQLINDLIEIAKIESNLVTITKESVSLQQLLMELKTIYTFEKKRINKDHISIKFIKPENDIIIKTDILRIKQVLMNVMKNALKFTTEGAIEIGYKHRKDKVDIYIKDSGSGIPVDKQYRIFDKFYKLDSDGQSQGTGIGLSISKSLMRMLGGDIVLESSNLYGSTFNISIPTIGENSYKVNKAEKTILIVEDEEDNYQLIKYIAKELNHRVIWARDGQEAITYTKNMDFDLILMDLKMPLVGGFSAAKEILKRKPNIPIIVQTAYVSSENIEKCKEIGCSDFITKPINLTKLRKTIGTYI